jgi:hypothetical protein
MKRAIPAGLLLLSLAVPLSAGPWEFGLLGGLRSLKNADLRDLFGSGLIYTPHVSYRISSGGSVGVSFEGGFRREANVGLFGDLFSLRVRGFEIFYRQEWNLGRVSPYIKIGPGLFLYDLHLDTPFLSAFNVHDSDLSFSIALGLNARLNRRVFLSGEIKYGVLWVDPFDDQVDLGGFRVQAGVGFIL